MVQLNDTNELRQSLENILELTLKTAQRLSTVLEECSTRMTDEDERGRLAREEVRGPEKLTKLKSSLTGRVEKDF